MISNDHYLLYEEFIETFAPTGFKNIDRNHPLLLQLEEVSAASHQFFHVADLILAQITWASSRSRDMMGIAPEELNAYHFIEGTHPDDIEKHALGRSKMFNVANDLFIAKKGKSLLSINIKMRNAQEGHTDLLFQLYFFYSPKFNTVFLFQVHTDIESFKKRKYGYHYYVGDDFRNFRYPDIELLTIGNPFSDREFEIIKLIGLGLASDQIAEKLSISIHTVNTHRKNILGKSNKSSFSEIIFDLQQQRLL